MDLRREGQNQMEYMLRPLFDELPTVEYNQ